jgi:hypothetical protein
MNGGGKRVLQLVRSSVQMKLTAPASSPRAPSRDELIDETAVGIFYRVTALIAACGERFGAGRMRSRAVLRASQSVGPRAVGVSRRGGFLAVEVSNSCAPRRPPFPLTPQSLSRFGAAFSSLKSADGFSRFRLSVVRLFPSQNLFLKSVVHRERKWMVAFSRARHASSSAARRPSLTLAISVVGRLPIFRKTWALSSVSRLTQFTAESCRSPDC